MNDDAPIPDTPLNRESIRKMIDASDQPIIIRLPDGQPTVEQLTRCLGEVEAARAALAAALPLLPKPVVRLPDAFDLCLPTADHLARANGWNDCLAEVRRLNPDVRVEVADG